MKVKVSVTTKEAICSRIAGRLAKKTRLRFKRKQIYVYSGKQASVLVFFSMSRDMPMISLQSIPS